MIKITFLLPMSYPSRSLSDKKYNPVTTKYQVIYTQN